MSFYDSRITAAINTSAATGLSGRSAVVTGASRGIGAEISRLLAASGVRVALLARTVTALDAVVAQIDNDAIAIGCDVTDEESVPVAASAVEGAFGGAPDILVNNAGAFHLASLHEMPLGRFSESLQTNVVAPFMMTRAFLAEMRARRSGHIVTIGSVAVDTDLWEPIDTESGASPFPARQSMLSADAVARAVLFAVTQPPDVNIDELRLSRS